MVANALIMEGENEVRDMDLREEPYLGVEED
jgi:hypothetical protein